MNNKLILIKTIPSVVLLCEANQFKVPNSTTNKIMLFETLGTSVIRKLTGHQCKLHIGPENEIYLATMKDK